MHAPHSVVIDERWILGPSFRTMMVDGGWKTMYVTKKTSEIMD